MLWKLWQQDCVNNITQWRPVFQCVFHFSVSGCVKMSVYEGHLRSKEEIYLQKKRMRTTVVTSLSSSQGKLFSSIQPEANINDVYMYPNSGEQVLLFLLQSIFCRCCIFLFLFNDFYLLYVFAASQPALIPFFIPFRNKCPRHVCHTSFILIKKRRARITQWELDEVLRRLFFYPYVF